MDNRLWKNCIIKKFKQIIYCNGYLFELLINIYKHVFEGTREGVCEINILLDLIAIIYILISLISNTCPTPICRAMTSLATYQCLGLSHLLGTYSSLRTTSNSSVSIS